MADDKKLDEIIKSRKEKDKREKMREMIKEIERQRRTKEDIRRIEELEAKRPHELGRMSRPSDIEKGSSVPRQGYLLPRRPRKPRSIQLTPEEAARMERLRDEFHGRTRKGTTQLKKGGKVKCKSKTNCRRGDGICKKGKTKGRMV